MLYQAIVCSIFEGHGHIRLGWRLYASMFSRRGQTDTPENKGRNHLLAVTPRHMRDQVTHEVGPRLLRNEVTRRREIEIFDRADRALGADRGKRIRGRPRQFLIGRRERPGNHHGDFGRARYLGIDRGDGAFKRRMVAGSKEGKAFQDPDMDVVQRVHFDHRDAAVKALDSFVELTARIAQLSHDRQGRGKVRCSGEGALDDIFRQFEMTSIDEIQQLGGCQHQ